MRVLLRLLTLAAIVQIAHAFAPNGFTALSGMRTDHPTGLSTRRHSNLKLTMKSRKDKVSMKLKRDKTAANYKLADFDTDIEAPINVIRPEIDPHAQITLMEYMEAFCKQNPHLKGLGAPLDGMQKGCREISALVTRAAITGLLGYANGGGSINVQGEEQKKLVSSAICRVRFPTKRC